MMAPTVHSRTHMLITCIHSSCIHLDASTGRGVPMEVQVHKQRVLHITLVLVCVHLQRGVLWFNVMDNILSVTSNYIFLMLPMVKNVESST